MQDCKLSSHASRALLHIESAQAFQPSVSQVRGSLGLGFINQGPKPYHHRKTSLLPSLLVKDMLWTFLLKNLVDSHAAKVVAAKARSTTLYCA